MADFSTIILTEAGDYFTKKEKQVEREEKGIEVVKPYIINEDEKAQEIQAEEIFVPYSALEVIQYGDFKHEIQK